MQSSCEENSFGVFFYRGDFLYVKFLWVDITAGINSVGKITRGKSPSTFFPIIGLAQNPVCMGEGLVVCQIHHPERSKEETQTTIKLHTSKKHFSCEFTTVVTKVKKV